MNKLRNNRNKLRNNRTNNREIGVATTHLSQGKLRSTISFNLQCGYKHLLKSKFCVKNVSTIGIDQALVSQNFRVVKLNGQHHFPGTARTIQSGCVISSV